MNDEQNHSEHSTAHSTSHTHMHAHSTPPATPPASKAWAIGLVVLLVVLIAGYLVVQKFSTPAPAPIPIDDGSITVKLLVDQQCKFCPQTDTILAKFDKSNMKYSLQTIDIFSTEGKTLAQQFDVNIAPTALVSVKGLDQNSTIQAALQGVYHTKSGYVVVPESFLDDQPRTLTFTQPPASTSCSMKAGTIRIDAFLDYACQPCAEAYFLLQRLHTDHPNVDVHITPVQYRRFTQATMDAATQNNLGAICAQKLGYFDDYTNCQMFSSQLGTVSDINEMTSCLLDAGGASRQIRDDFKACVQDADNTGHAALLENIKQAYAWEIPSHWTPAFVFDCKYTFVGHKDLPLFLCQTHPELAGCDAALEAAKNPVVEDHNKLNIYNPANIPVTYDNGSSPSPGTDTNADANA